MLLLTPDFFFNSKDRSWKAYTITKIRKQYFNKNVEVWTKVNVIFRNEQNNFTKTTHKIVEKVRQIFTSCVKTPRNTIANSDLFIGNFYRIKVDNDKITQVNLKLTLQITLFKTTTIAISPPSNIQVIFLAYRAKGCNTLSFSGINLSCIFGIRRQ